MRLRLALALACVGGLLALGATRVGNILFDADFSIASDGTVSVGAFTGDVTKTAGSLATTVAKVNGNTAGGSCSAHQFTNSVDTSARPSCAQPATTDLSDFTAPTSWTPTDVSAGALTLTVNAATYTKIGRICVLTFDITYPSTADTSSAQVGSVPATCTFASSAMQAGTVGGQGGGAQVVNQLWSASTTSVFLMRSSGVAATNANLTGARVRASIVVITAS